MPIATKQQQYPENPKTAPHRIRQGVTEGGRHVRPPTKGVQLENHLRVMHEVIRQRVYVQQHPNCLCSLLPNGQRPLPRLATPPLCPGCKQVPFVIPLQPKNTLPFPSSHMPRYLTRSHVKLGCGTLSFCAIFAKRLHKCVSCVHYYCICTCICPNRGPMTMDASTGSVVRPCNKERD